MLVLWCSLLETFYAKFGSKVGSVQKVFKAKLPFMLTSV